MRVQFQEHKILASCYFKCIVCGKKVRKQKTFTETENPFNKNKDGSVKSVEDTYKSLELAAENWQAGMDRSTCSKCD